MAHLIDLVDHSGKIRLTGIKRSNADIHEGLFMQIIITVVFDKQGKVIIHKRSHEKKVNPGDIDHVCGGIKSGETPEEAAYRETLEEVGVKLNSVNLVAKGINEYDRYRYLAIGRTSDEPKIVIPEEVIWVGSLHHDELTTKHKSGELSFVDGFFADLEKVKSFYS